jgi:hypothetical protein
MALNARERLLVGFAVNAAVFIGLGYFLVLPAVNGVTESQAKIKTLQSELTTLKSQTTMVEADLTRLASAQSLPSDVVIRAFNGQTLEKNLKEMLDQVITLGTQTGNAFISLEPVKEEQASAAPPPPTKKPIIAVPGQTEAAEKVAPPSPEEMLKVYPYKLAFRGRYEQVLRFLGVLNQHKEIIEITEVTVSNEGGAQRQEYKGGQHYDMAKPIRLSMNVKLILQPAELAPPTTTASTQQADPVTVTAS